MNANYMLATYWVVNRSRILQFSWKRLVVLMVEAGKAMAAKSLLSSSAGERAIVGGNAPMCVAL